MIDSDQSAFSLSKAALIAGLGLLLMAVLAPIANFAGYENLLVADDAAATVQNISESEGLFRVSIALFLIVGILDIVAAWALYILFQPVDKRLSLLTAWFRLVYAAVLVASVQHLLSALDMMHAGENLPADATGVLQSLEAFGSGWSAGMVIFSMHLIFMGYLVIKSNYTPGIIGWLLILAGAGYMIDNFAGILVPEYNLELAMYTFIGEVVLIFWLLIKGVRIQRNAE